jgi:hypothetical protein
MATDSQHDVIEGTMRRFSNLPEPPKVFQVQVESYEAKFDGTDRPPSVDSAPSTASLKRIDDYTIEETSKQDGKIVGVKRMTVSKDGKSMKVETTDKKRGTTMTYTAEKH